MSNNNNPVGELIFKQLANEPALLQCKISRGAQYLLLRERMKFDTCDIHLKFFNFDFFYKGVPAVTAQF